MWTWQRRQAAYNGYLETQNNLLRWQSAYLGMHREPIWIPIAEQRQRRCRLRRERRYIIVPDGKTNSDRLDEASEQLSTANVILPDDITLQQVVALYSTVPANLQKAVRIQAAKIRMQNVIELTNDEQIELANLVRIKLKEPLEHYEEDHVRNVYSALMKAFMDQLEIIKYE